VCLAGFVEEIMRRRRIQTDLHLFRIVLVDYIQPPRFLMAKNKEIREENLPAIAMV
jgi:hypothetical protein